MTRTKTRRIASKKRGSADDRIRIENKLRDFDVTVDCELANLEIKFRDEMDRIQRLLDALKIRIPKKFMSLTMREIREYNEEADKIDASFYGDRTAMVANFSTILEKSARKKSKDDEENEYTERLSTMSASKRPGPLMTAKYRNRSNSACTIDTSVIRKNMCSTIDRSALGKSFDPKINLTANDRMSRSKIKTPMINRPKAISVDRIYEAIKPKVQPNTPLAIIRHARLGESVYSVTGSPVITANMLESTANVNIPVKDGVLSIRPTEIEAIDPAVIRKIDANSLAELKQLQENLNLIMRTLEL